MEKFYGSAFTILLPGTGGDLDFFTRHWGDLASVVGVAVSLWTLFVARSARAAAEEAKRRISVLDTVSAVSAAIASMEEIKAHQRSADWMLVLHLYSSLRRSLILIQQSHPEVATRIGEALTHFRVIEDLIERALSADRMMRLNPADFNKIVSKQMDELGRVLATIKEVGA